MSFWGSDSAGVPIPGAVLRQVLRAAAALSMDVGL